MSYSNYPQGYNKAEQTKKRCSLKEPVYKNKDYLAYLHDGTHNCYVCGSKNIEVHHLDAGAKGRSDKNVICLCPEHHRGDFSPHGSRSIDFYKRYPRDTLQTFADILFHEYDTGVREDETIKMMK